MIKIFNSPKIRIIFLWLSFLSLILNFFPILTATGQSEVVPTPFDELEKVQQEVGSQLMPVYEDPIMIVVKIINYLLTFIGAIFVVMILYGGIKWMLARGNEEEIKKAKDLLKNAAWGLVFLIVARVIYIFIRERITSFGSSGTMPGGGGGGEIPGGQGG